MEQKKERIWVLGSPDPEMERIETLLIRAGDTYGYASPRAPARVFGGDANKATEVLRPAPSMARVVQNVSTSLIDLADYRHVIVVECRIIGHSASEIVDHHSAGDPGYGCPPDQHLVGSSLGQVIRLLGRGGYIVAPEERDASPVMTPWGSFVSRLDAIISAADHSLGAAYRGECPPLTPEEIAEWRISSRASFQRRDPEALRAAVEAAKAHLRAAPRVALGDGIEVADIRGPVVAEIPEAAMQADLAYVSGPLECPDGRKKFTCSGRPEHVRLFLAHAAALFGLVDLYGDPVRGFAGGYLP